ncbi:T9SS type A sorting domain-containing protein [Pseudochryseolinea flava]|uniref:Secretion system C-terminal sorting domain-containing protein n=1 Tax=Pseudochryseolinea flava TaxID=2059302 RepID=A0A364Y252_9BACT|nr:T9SS type A sorting domain-containing protein [Pseudochryseolinea flava]RAW00737.1 hypothetical protein DQQ10_14255 [Pseudochryseolinea flava]
MRLLRNFTAAVIAILLCFELFAQDRTTPQETQSETVDLAKSVQLFPNPAIEFVHIRVDRLNSADVKLTLHNIIGNQVAVETDIVDEHELRVKVKDLATGYYLIAVRDEKLNFRGTYKFLKR